MIYRLPLATFVVALTLLVSVANSQTIQPSRCYTCLYAERQGERPTGVLNCMQPSVSTVRSEMCNGNCYKINVLEKDRGIQYLQRGCLPSCRSHNEYPVAHYGVGSIHCCRGDLCNSSTTTRVNYLFLVALAVVSSMARLFL